MNTEVEQAARAEAPLTAERVVIGDTVFTFRKALAIEQFYIFEKLRPHMVPVADVLREAWEANKSSGGHSSEVMLAYGIKAIAALPGELVQIALNELTKHVLFTNETVKTPMPVARDIDTAFAGLGVVKIYEVLIRAGCVNFQNSLDELMSMQGLLQGSEG